MNRHRLLLAFALTMMGTLAAAPAISSGGKQQQVAIQIVFLWKKLPVGRINIDARVNARRYAIKMHTKAVGILWVFTRWTTIASTEGRIVGQQVHPLRYRSDSNFRSSKSLIELTYPAPGKTVTQVTPLKSNADWTPVPEAQRQGAPDPLTAIIASLRPRGANPCAWTGEIYDGRRRYRLSLRQEGQDTLSSNMWNRYAGPAIRCRIITKTLAGWYKKGRTKKRKPRPAPTIWFARINGAGMWLPVKLMAHTRWGRVRGELFRYKFARAN
jgi:hypothetical protein